MLEIFKRQAGEPRADAGVTVKIGERTCWLLDEVREAEQGCSYDAVFTDLLDAYDSLYRSGLLAQVKHVAGVALFDLFAHRQDRLLVKRAMQVTVSPDLFTFFQKAALTYARACVEEEEEEEGDNAGVGGVAERKVLLNVSKQTWARFAQAKEELGIASDDEVLVLLQKAYALTYYSDPFDLIDQVEEVVSLAISSLRLGVDKQSLIKEAMKYEGVTKAFAFLQESILMYAEAIVSDERGSDQFSENKQE